MKAVASGAGAARKHAALRTKRAVPTTAQISITNLDASEQKFTVLDALQSVSAADAFDNGDQYISTPFKGGIAGFREFIKSHPVLISAMQLEVDSPQTFTKDFEVAYGDINGKVVRDSIASDIQAAKNAANQIDTLLTVPFKALLDGHIDLLVNVPAGETYTITFIIDDIHRLR